MEYRYLASSPDGFVSQVVRYVSAGHVFYFTGGVPEGRIPHELDAKLIGLYQTAQAPWTRSRRRGAGGSSVHYLRCGSRFVLLASAGRGPFFEELGELRDAGGRVIRAAQYRDIRRVALKFDAYSIRSTCCAVDRRRDSHRRRVLVRLNRDTYGSLKRHFVHQATRLPRPTLEAMVWSLGFYPYRPVLEQIWSVVRAANRARRAVGLEELDGKRCIRRRKPPLKVF